MHTRSVRRALQLGVLALLAAAVASCGSPEDAKNVDYQRTTYDGKDLYCGVMQDRDDEHTYDCDFVGMYLGNPSPPAITGDIREGFFKVITDTTTGKPLTCLTYPSSGDYYARTCDYAKYYQVGASITPTPSVTPSSGR